MTRPLKILLVGIGGYGQNYVNELLENLSRENLKISGVIDLKPELSDRYGDLVSMGTAFFSCVEDFYSQNEADIAIISSPIQYHSPQACTAMLNGSHVLCEKPLSGSVEDGLKMIETKKKTGKLLAVGYQMSYSKTVLNLKNDIISGMLGKPIRCRTVLTAPRNRAYYMRNSWAGKLCDSQGNYIRDSVANNANAHYLHNMLYLLGEHIDSSSMPETVQAELYRANPIETFDTAAVRIMTQGNVEVTFFTTHATKEVILPRIAMEFENGIVEYDGTVDEDFKVICRDGSIIRYGDPNEDQMNKLWSLVEAVRNNTHVACGPESALAHTICIEAMHNSMEPVDFPPDIEKFDEDERMLWVDGLSEVLLSCYENWALPSEMNIGWAKQGKKIRI